MRPSLARWTADAYKRGSIAKLVQQHHAQSANTRSLESVQVQAWIRSVRKQKKYSFLSLSDGSSHSGLQAVVSNDVLGNLLSSENDASAGHSLATGASVRLQGKLVAKQGGRATSIDAVRDNNEVELHVEAVEVLGACDGAAVLYVTSYNILNIPYLAGSSYPMQKKDHSYPFLRRNAHFRGRTALIAAMLRVRDAMTRSAYNYFAQEGYLNVAMPLITSSDCEGAGEVFSIVHGPSRKPFYDDPAYLTVSGQLHLEAMAVGGALGRAWHLTPAFRAERSDTNRHLNEFWMLEAELSFTESLEDVLQTVENLIRRISKDVSSQLEPVLRTSLPSGWEAVQSVNRAPRWQRMTYAQAIKELQQTANAEPERFQHTPAWSSGLRSEHERFLADKYGPTFVTDYPVSQKPFYMRLNDSPTSGNAVGAVSVGALSSFADADEPTVACFDLLVPRIGELVGGSLREERLDRLRESMANKGMDETSYEWYLDLRRYGSVPHGGFGLGWERLVSWLTGIENVRECIAFPRAAEGSRF